MRGGRERRVFGRGRYKRKGRLGSLGNATDKAFRIAHGARAAAFGFMMGAFGQIPINDFMIGKMASGTFRARIYGIRYVIGFTVLGATLPLIAFVYENWGFDILFHLLAGAALVILAAVTILPKALPIRVQITVAGE